MYSPLVWAYIGDAVYELRVRERLIEKSYAKPHTLHLRSIKLVNAKKQARILEGLEETLTEEEKIAFTLYNFVYLEENLIRKNSDKITELTISIYNCLGYLSKCLFLYSYIKQQIIDDKATYIRNNNLKINIKNCDDSEDEKKLLREMGEILFTLRNCIVHNHFEVENGILKIDSDTKEYIFEINIPVSLLHYMIIPVLELRMEAGEIHACGYDDRLCYEMHRRQIPFTSVENSSLYQRKLLSKNDEEEILKLDQSFSEKDLTIWGGNGRVISNRRLRIKRKSITISCRKCN